MKTPAVLAALMDDGVIDAVIGQLKSGKEASVFLVRCRGETRCAKVYKDAQQRGFHKLAEYQEGRRARGSRDQRAMSRRSKHGRAEQEMAWKNAEVDALYRLQAAGVRVPRPHGYFDGVLIMEVITDGQGNAAPRLNEVAPSPEQAREWHAFLMSQIVRMLCAGLIHGDLSEFNVLVGPEGPVIIDLPQAVDAAGNNNAFRMLQRDVNNITAYCGQAAPELLAREDAHELWKLYESRELKPDTVLTGRFEHSTAPADVDAVMRQIEEARREAERRELGRLAAEAREQSG